MVALKACYLVVSWVWRTASWKVGQMVEKTVLMLVVRKAERTVA